MFTKPMVAEVVTTEDLQRKLAAAGATKVVVVDFTASWCGPCKKIAPVLHELAATHAHNFGVFTADVDHAQQLVNHFKVSSMPTFIFFYKNTVVSVLKGADETALRTTFGAINGMLRAIV